MGWLPQVFAFLAPATSPLPNYLSEATYRVFTNDSPSPFSPGNPTPSTYQPPIVARGLVTLSALDTNASPNGWIDDGVNETRGNNVDAHADRNNDNLPDLPRPQGSPFRVFDFALDLTQSPASYGEAAVVQLFYWNNWMHDQLYQLGFTEAAANFQNDNFSRGGLGNDAVQADAQDGGGYNNANFSTPPDGYAPRMQMYLFTGPSPGRDGDLDAEVILHEYTHGLSNRRVGGGVGISALQSQGLGEGWSDFYALSLLSEAGDDIGGVYAPGGYASYLLAGFTQNYYFGNRRYPYCIDLNKNPLTFKDIDPAQASSHPGVPRSPIIGGNANEVHNLGEVWCVALWEARANLLHKHGWPTGNRLMLQLVTDGMSLAPANPNFLQARDALLQADLVATGGANQTELWAAFAKRGMGPAATSPSSPTTAGVQESFDLPGEVSALAWAPVSSPQVVGQPFTVTLTALDSLGRVLTNFAGPVALSCSISNGPQRVAIRPTVSGAFTNGQWAGSLEVQEPARGAVLKADDGLGHVGLSNPFNAVPSNAPPTIWTQPASQTARVGKSVSFWVDADGTPPLSYQWSCNGTNLDGATMSSLTLTNVQLDQAGDYAVLVTNAFGSILSSNAALSVVAAPPCAPLPAGLIAWWRAEGDGSDAVGTNNGVLVNGVSFTNGLVGQAFGFNGIDGRVIVSNASSLNFGSNQDLSIEAWINPLPSTTDFGVMSIVDKRLAPGPSQSLGYEFNLSDGRVHCRLSAFYSGNGKDFGPAGPDLRDGDFHHVALTVERISITGGHLYVDGQRVLTFDPTSQAGDLSNSEPLHIGNHATPSLDCFFNGRIDEVSLYSRALSDAEILAIYTAAGSGKCVTPIQPWVTSQPASQTVAVGGTAKFTVAALGTRPLCYQWLKDGLSLPGATDFSCTLSHVQTNDAGIYSVMVSNLVGSVLSSNALLTVLSPSTNCAPTPANLVGWWRGDGNGGDAAGTNDAVRFGGTTFTNGLVGQAFAFNGVDGRVVVSNAPELNFTSGRNFSVEAWISPLPSTTDYDVMSVVDKRLAPTANGCVGYEFNLTGGRVHCRLSSAISGNGTEWGPAGPDLRDGKFHHVALTLDRSSTTGGHLYVDGQAVLSFDPTSQTGDLSNTEPFRIGHHAISSLRCFFKGTIDELSLCSRALSASEILSIYNAGSGGKCVPPPTIVSQPQGCQVVQGGSAAFAVTAIGVAPMSYQWSLNGKNLPGATNRTLNLTSVQPGQAGSYAVLVSNPFGSVLSSSALLVVLMPPRIERHPLRQLVVAGCRAVFSVVASGTPPLEYQWLKDGLALSGQTNASLALDNVQTNDLGNYRVVVTNAYGAATSSSAVLGLDRPPVAVPDIIQRFAAGGVRVHAAALLANDTDPDGDALAVCEVGSTSAAGGAVTLNGSWIYYEPPPGFTNTDSFAYTVSDGNCGGRGVGIVTVQIRSDNAPVSQLRIDNMGDGSFRVGVDGLPGATYRVQSAESLPASNWEDLAAGTADGFGVFEYIHRPPTNAPARFYRSVWP